MHPPWKSQNLQPPETYLFLGVKSQVPSLVSGKELTPRSVGIHPPPSETRMKAWPLPAKTNAPTPVAPACYPPCFLLHCSRAVSSERAGPGQEVLIPIHPHPHLVRI